MYAPVTQLNFEQPLYNPALSPTRTPTGLREPTRSYETIAPRMIRSVVEEAGLGRFVYLQGLSGKRYVFSSISQEQVSLYDNALFAISEPGGEFVRVSEKMNELRQPGCLFYVHLLDDNHSNRQEVMADLGGAH